MPQTIKCDGCNKTLKAPDELAGKRVRCPACKTVVEIPALPTPQEGSEFDWSQPLEPNETSHRRDDEFPDADDLPELPAAPRRRVKQAILAHDEEQSTFIRTRGIEGDGEPHPTAKSRRKPTSSHVEDSSNRGWRDSLHWVLALALVPLALSIALPESSNGDRLAKVLHEHPEIQGRLEQAQSMDDVFAALPDERFPGAHLPRKTLVHWAYALASAMLFLLLLVAMFPGSQVGISRLMWTGIITGTVGILLLIGFQWVAEVTQHYYMRGRSIVVLLFYLVKFIGFSYRCATDGDTGFLLSFMGFTCGVGLCEELCKGLPIAIYLGTAKHADWRGACLVGLASGIGFGVSEGIMYSSDYYNGIAPGMTYLVRFASCVALHAVWASAVALLMYGNQDYLTMGADDFEWSDVAKFVLFYLGTAMVLHGLYDTLLKQDLALGALVVAAASFGWWAWLLRQQRVTG